MFMAFLSLKKHSGFTLIELLVVVLIIGVLSAIALPRYFLAVEKARAAEALTLVRQIADANKRYRLLYGEYSDDIGKLELDQDFPGDLRDFGGTVTRRTKYFDYRATASPAGNGKIDGSSGIAVARRIDSGNTYSDKSERYYAFIFYPENRFTCSDGENSTVCKSLGF